MENVYLTGFSVLLTPPVSLCVACNQVLAGHDKPCDVTIYGLRGKVPGIKFSLCCDHCKLNYNYNQYGNKVK